MQYTGKQSAFEPQGELSRDVTEMHMYGLWGRMEDYFLPGRMSSWLIALNSRLLNFPDRAYSTVVPVKIANTRCSADLIS